MLKLWIVSGDEAKAAFHDGERDPLKLRGLGFYAEFQFNSLEEMKAFILGFETCENLEDAKIWHSTTLQIEIG